MTDEVAEKNNVVAADCCNTCVHNIDRICQKTDTWTFPTDICGHFKRIGESTKSTMKKDNNTEKEAVVSAICCEHCAYHYHVDYGQRTIYSWCNNLDRHTYKTDVCDNFKEFKGSILSTMKKDNQSDKEEKYVGTVTVSIPKDMFEKLKKKAQEDFRDLNMEILYAIDKMLNDVATISYTPVWNDKKWEEYWPGDNNTTPIRPVNFPVDPNKNWDGSPKITCSNA